MALSPTDAIEHLLHRGARVMVVAPHPDDETLASGGLLRRATRAGATTRVLLLTDGDNNPWPQRWLERRWRIDTAARQRWGRRRREEARLALTTLGLTADAIHALGWPDLGITDRLLHAGVDAAATLAQAIDDFAPTLLVLPSLADSHPDHSAAAILVEQAITQCRTRPRCIAYRIHGQRPLSTVMSLPLDAGDVEAKRQAVLAYASQVSLSRNRLLALVRVEECFEPVAAAAPWPWRFPAVMAGMMDMLVVQGRRAWRQPLASRDEIRRLVDRAGSRAEPLYVKPRLRLPSPWIFDRYGWWRLA